MPHPMQFLGESKERKLVVGHEALLRKMVRRLVLKEV